MLLFFVLPLLFIGAALLAHAAESLDTVQKNWNQYRCNPMYMPFAGMIRDDTTTSQNFYQCMNVFGNEVLKVPLDGLGSGFKLIGSGLAELTAPIPLFRALFGRIRKFMLSFGATTFSKIASSSSVFIHYLIKIRDVLKRFVGQGYIASYLTYTLVSFLESFVVLFISILKAFIGIMLAISIVLALFQPELLAIVLVIASLLSAAGA
jgi:hypothetical protein